MLTEIPQFTAAFQAPGALVPQIVLQWNLVPGGGTNIYRDGVLIAANVGGLETSDTGIEWNQQYIYRISATDGVIESGLSVPVMITASPVNLPFATSEELAAYWRALTAEESTRATSLLLIASNRLRAYDIGNDPDLDTRSASDPNYRSLLNWITMEAVKRAMQSPVDQPSVESYGQTAGVYSENFKYTNPTGDLFFRKSELRALGLSGGQSLGSITPITSSDIYSEQ